MVPQALHGKEGQIINAKISSLIEAYWTSRLQLVYRYFRSFILVFILRCHDFSFCIHWREASNSVIKQSDDIYSLFENRSRLRHSYSSSCYRKERAFKCLSSLQGNNNIWFCNRILCSLSASSKPSSLLFGTTSKCSLFDWYFPFPPLWLRTDMWNVCINP